MIMKKGNNISSKVGWLLLAIGIIFACSRGAYRYYAKFDYRNTISNNWDLSERASTISQKSEYMNKFVAALETQHLTGLNSNLWFQTPSTSFDENMKALKSLQKRLIDISGMDETTMAYQTAIQQITAQEQGEGKSMLDVLYKCWQRQNYYTIWNPLISGIFLLIQGVLIFFGWTIIKTD